MENKKCSNGLVIDIDGQKRCIERITRYTTCDDVIEMIFYKSKMETASYAVFESSFGVERMLHGKESILKVVRSWGADKNSYTLLIRKVDNIKSNMATISQAKRKLRKMRSQNVKKVTSANKTIQANLNHSCRKQTIDKDIGKSAPETDQEKYTKLGLLKRFLSDVMLQKRRQTKEMSRSQMAIRTCTPGDECSETLDSQIFQSYVKTDTCFNTVNDNKCLTRHRSYLNTAFVDGDDKSDSETSNDDTTDNDSIAFNRTNILIDTMVHVDNSISSDNESAFEEESICELERNISESSDSGDSVDLDSTDNQGSFYKADNTVIKCDRIIHIFQNVVVNCDDDELETDDDYMESFMNTVVYNSDSDEGMGSLESDSEYY